MVEGRWWKHTVQAYLWPTAARLTVNSPKNTQVSFLGPARTAWFITGSHAWWRCSHLAFHFLGRLKGCDLFLYAQRSTIYPQPKWKNIQSPTVLSGKKCDKCNFLPPGPCRHTARNTWVVLFPTAAGLTKYSKVLECACYNFLHRLNSSGTSIKTQMKHRKSNGCKWVTI